MDRKKIQNNNLTVKAAKKNMVETYFSKKNDVCKSHFDN